MPDHPRKSIVRPANNIPYVVAVVAMVGLTVAAIVIITIARPGYDNGPLIGQIASIAAPTTLALLAFMKSQETHLSVNSRLDEFIATSDAAARGEGEKAGIEIGMKQAVKQAEDITQILREREDIPLDPK